MGTMGGTTSGNGSPPTPLCRCRVLYIGCAVPTVTKDGLQVIFKLRIIILKIYF
jgi:hypothetical protein